MEEDAKESKELTWQQFVKMSKETLIKYFKDSATTQYLGQIEIVFSFLKGLYNESQKQTKLLTELVALNKK